MSCRQVDKARLLFIAIPVIALVACGDIAAPVGPQQAPPTGEVWTTYRGDLRNDGHPATARLNASESARLGLAWRVKMGAAVNGSPAVSNGLVVAASQGGQIAAYTSSSGTQVWAASGLGPISDSPMIVDDRVVAASLSGHAYAFDLRRGTRLWDWTAPGIKPAIWSSPVVYGQLVLIGIGSQYGDAPFEIGRIVALNVTSGREAWEMCVLAGCSPGGGIWSTPAVDSEGRGFVGTGNPVDGILAFDALTGRRLWITSFYADAGLDLDVGASPVLLEVDGREAVGEGSAAGTFKLLDAATGVDIWSRNLVSQWRRVRL